nr:MAG TPA: hypothetical protein [Caudoviricetes sp.]
MRLFKFSLRIASPFTKNFALSLIYPVLIEVIFFGELYHPLVRDELAAETHLVKDVFRGF